MKPADVYFTWPDKRLTYECATCGACCRGLGIGLDAVSGQVEALAARYPELSAFVRKRGPAWTAFNPRGRCWFLDEQGLCRVEAEHGRSVKPASCRLFPFNRIFVAGTTLVVDFNSVICPMGVAAPGEGIAHDEVLEEVRAIADPAVVGTPLGDTANAGWLALERRVARAVFERADDSGPDLEGIWKVMADARGGYGATAEALSEAARFITGEPLARPGPETLARALWLTPSMRFNELFGPRSYESRSSMQQLLPGIWLTWLHFLALGERLAARSLTLQEATTAWSEVMPLAYLAARWRDQVGLDADQARVVASEPERTWVMGLAAGWKRGGGSLGEATVATLGPLRQHERVAALRAAEPLLVHLRFPRRQARRARRR